MLRGNPHLHVLLLTK